MVLCDRITKYPGIAAERGRSFISAVVDKATEMVAAKDVSVIPHHNVVFDGINGRITPQVSVIRLMSVSAQSQTFAVQIHRCHEVFVHYSTLFAQDHN